MHFRTLSIFLSSLLQKIFDPSRILGGIVHHEAVALTEKNNTKAIKDTSQLENEIGVLT